MLKFATTCIRIRTFKLNFASGLKGSIWTTAISCNFISSLEQYTTEKNSEQPLWKNHMGYHMRKWLNFRVPRVWKVFMRRSGNVQRAEDLEGVSDETNPFCARNPAVPKTHKPANKMMLKRTIPNNHAPSFKCLDSMITYWADLSMCYWRWISVKP